MPTETEHKYLVNKELWQLVKPYKSTRIQQAYLSTDPDKTIRVRTSGDNGYITIKGRSLNYSLAEYEYAIPLTEAQELIANFCLAVVEKTRHLVKHGSHVWEVDEFLGSNAGLIVAEIELSSNDEVYELPEWVGQNVSDDVRYANSNLGLKPYSTW
ncbi:MAG: CYTH domain-containing protein [Bacteroidia bacterium]|nr:CYTH domain-containing protein [Bacteroidia bacterium]